MPIKDTNNKETLLLRLALLSLVIITSSAGTALCKEAKKPRGPAKAAVLFQQHCASCHAGGGNSVKPGKPIIGSKTLSSFPTFKSYLNQPLGDMPHYPHLTDDHRVLKMLYDYCKKLKGKVSKADSSIKSSPGRDIAGTL